MTILFALLLLVYICNVARPASVRSYETSATVIDVVKREVKNLANQSNVTAWMDLIRTARQPQVLWEVDFVKPKKDLLVINDLIRESEQILYESESSVILLPEFTADLSQQAAFNTVRARIRSEEGKTDVSLQMFDDIYEVFYDDLPIIRQSNLLFHCCLVTLCNKDFEKSCDYFDQHWALTKYISSEDRISLGLLDNQTILQCIYWFFIKHSSEFRDFYSVRYNVSSSSVYNHKKIGFLNMVQYDITWVVSMCGLPFYDHARIKIPSLPRYEIKRSTPINADVSWQSNEDWQFTQKDGAEKYYADLFNRLLTTERASVDDLSNALFSYYHFQNNYEIDHINKSNLLLFVHETIGPNTYDSIIDVGCGTNPILTPKKSVRIDISEIVAKCLLEESRKNVHNCCMSVYMGSTEETYDLCFASDVLQDLPSYRLQSFLRSTAQKCKYLAALIDTREDVRRDILNDHQAVDSITVAHTVTGWDGWKAILSEHFDILHHKVNDHLIYVICEKRA